MSWLSRIFTKEPDKYLTELPPRVKEGLTEYIGPDETVLFTLKSRRAIYKSPRWIDNNLYYKTWLIITSKRVLILRNSSSFHPFRDIPLNSINRTLHESREKEYKITIETRDCTDITEFESGAVSHCEEFRKVFDRALENRRDSSKHAGSRGVIKYCRHCGVELPQPSKFCPECGERL